MFTFLVPLVGRTPRISWDRVCNLLGATLKSVLAQTDTGFRVLVAGQDRPDLPEFDDPRVTFLTVAFPSPTTVEAERADQYAKLHLLARESILRGADAIAIVDADDRVSRRLVEYYRAFPHPTGYIYRRGYVWDYASGCLTTSDDAFGRPFHLRCGTCSIMALSEVRRRLGDDVDALVAHIRGFGHHTEFAERAATQGRPFADLPFPGAVYVLNHGDGLAYRRGWKGDALARRHARIRRFRIDVTPEMRKEFSLTENFQPGVARRWQTVTWLASAARGARAWSRKLRGRTRGVSACSPTNPADT